jgi:subtilisin family serine protease
MWGFRYDDVLAARPGCRCSFCVFDFHSGSGGTSLPQAAIEKLSDPAAILSALAEEDRAFVRVIVDVAMPALPDIATYADEDEADAARIAASHRAQNGVIGRVFALEGGIQGVMGAGEAAERLNIRQMDFLSRFAVNADAELLSRLASDPDVVRIDPDREVGLYLNQGNPTSLEVIQMPTAWTAGATGAGQHVAILDTGGRRTHKFLNSRIVSAACYKRPQSWRQQIQHLSKQRPGVHSYRFGE